MTQIYENLLGKVEKIIFYNPNSQWGVFKMSNSLTNDTVFKEPSILVAGNFEGVYESCIVEVSGEHKYHPKFKDQIALSFLKIKKEVSNKESVVNWLSKSSIKGISIQNAIKVHKKFGEETIEVVLNDTNRLLEIKGIGEKTLKKVTSSVNKYKQMEDLIGYCIPLGFTYNIINKLYTSLGKKAVKVLRDSIYNALEYSDSITFKQLDTIAINNNIDPEDLNRLKYGFLYTLKNRVMFEGSTGCGMQNLKEVVSKELGIKDINVFYKTLSRLEQDNKIQLHGNNVFFKYFYDIEKSISEKVKDLIYNGKEVQIDCSIIEEEINNFPFKLNGQQIQSINSILKNNFGIITGAGGCVDKETEYLTPLGWKSIADYTAGDQIAIYHKKGGSISFEEPLQYHKYPATEWYLLHNKGSLDQKLSGEHRVPYITWKKDNFKVRTMEDIYNISKKHVGFEGKFITGFNNNKSTKKLNYTDEYLRLVMSMLLKGKMVEKIKGINKYSTIEKWALKTKYEEERVKLEVLFNKCKIKYTITHDKNDINIVNYECELNRLYESFPKKWYLLNQDQLRIVYEEASFWGRHCRINILMSTRNKEVADFIQYAAITCGFRSTIVKRKNRYVVSRHRVTLIKLKDNNGYKGESTEIIKVRPEENEFKYCFTTSSKFWIARRNNRVLVSGNSGKSSILKAVANIFHRGGFNVVLLSPTGKASRRLEECTGRKAHTIHKFLGLKSSSIEDLEVKKVPRNTALIVDESSMLDIILFNKLLDSLNNDTRLILIGDNRQLPSIMAGNVLGDLISSDKASVNTLTDVMRQSKNSNIIKYCNKINNGKTIKECDNEDLYYETFTNRKALLDKFSLLYDKELLSIGSDNIQIITPYKKGDIGVNKINKYIRDNYNENKLDEKFNFKVNDKIMHIKNNYEKDIFNGEVGVVTEINEEEDYLEATYDNNKVIYEIDDIEEAMLAYCCSIHKVQGSEYHTVFVLLDDENNLLLSRKILYTACSRARKKLYILSMNDSVNECIENNYSKPRTTLLKNFLIE